MALGVDTIFAIAALELKNEGYNIIQIDGIKKIDDYTTIYYLKLML